MGLFYTFLYPISPLKKGVFPISVTLEKRGSIHLSLPVHLLYRSVSRGLSLIHICRIFLYNSSGAVYYSPRCEHVNMLMKYFQTENQSMLGYGSGNPFNFNLTH